jgi:mono/diheme cytochrome c family protein
LEDESRVQRMRLLAGVATLAAVTGGTAARAAFQGDQVAAGQAVFQQICSQCHGDQGEGGEGPPIIGRGNALADYRNALRLFNYLLDAMPNDDPGRLSAQQYYDVLAYLLSQNNWNPEGLQVDASTAESISLGP